MHPEVPLACPQFDEAEAAALSAVLHSRRWSFGPALTRFEREMAQLCGRRHGVGVNSGTAALQIALEALGIGPGDEVLVPAFTFVGSVNAIVRAGAEPVLVDVDPLTLNIDPASAAAAVGPRTRAVLPVHLFGRPAPMAALGELASRHRLRIVEDACEAAGARDAAGPAGRGSDVACFAFYPNKPVAVGEGGMLVMDDPDLARRARQLRNQGIDPESGSRLEDRPGLSARLSEWHAALGSVQLARLEQALARRAELATLYRRHLAADARIELPAPEPPGQRIAWFTFPLRLVEAHADGRDALLSALRAAGIGCGTYFTPVHWLPYHRGRYRQVPLPVSEDVGRRCLALPLHGEMDAQTVDRVCTTLLRLLDRLCPSAP